VTSAVQDSNGIIEIKNDIDGMELSKRDISKILAEIYSLQQELDLLPDTSIIPVITAIQDLDTNIYKLEERENEITSIVESLSTLDKELNNTILPDPYYLSKLDTITVEIKALEKKEEALEKLLKDILSLEVELAHSVVTQTKLEKEFIDELKSNGICPLCGRKPK
jgi:DNA repair exonuclease SbcCD ATPase subunit